MDDNTMVMPVSPMGNNNWGGGLFGGDASWIIIFLFALMFGGFGGGWGMNSFGGFGGMWGAEGMFPWLLASNQQTNGLVTNGFDNAATMSAINGVQSSVTSGFGDVQTALCGGFAGVNASINGAQNAIAQQLYTNQIADLERSYAAQTASTQSMNNIAMSLQNCCCENRANIADLKYTVATENCADRAALSDGIKDVIASNTAQTQAILDKLCQLELDGFKRENDNLRSQLTAANLAASQTAQTADIVNQTYARLSSCPTPSVPVYGNNPIFTCAQNVAGSNCGCGCGSF